MPKSTGVYRGTAGGRPNTKIGGGTTQKASRLGRIASNGLGKNIPGGTSLFESGYNMTGASTKRSAMSRKSKKGQRHSKGY